MTLSPEQVAQIRRLHFAERWRVGTIVAQLALHRDAVRHALGLDSPLRRLPPACSPLEPFKDFVVETLAQYPTLRATRLFLMIRERGYTGSVRALRRFVRRVRPRRSRTVYTRVETFPGEQAQVDWAMVCRCDVPGGRRDLWIFVMVLAHSRMLFAQFVWDLTASSLRRSLLDAHVFFGGSPREWLFDNARCVVVARDGAQVRFHEGLTELSGQLLTSPRLCKVRAPQEKGKVERAVRYLREAFLAARTIRDPAEGNAALVSFLRDVAPARPHPNDTTRTVGEVFAEERARLLALPSPMPSREHTQPVTVDATAAVRVDGNDYSVPARYAAPERRGDLTAALDASTVRMLDGGQEVARHARCWGRRQRIEDPAHRAEVIALRPGVAPLKGRERLREELPGIEALLSRWFEDGRNTGSVVARTIKALDLYGVTAMRVAVQDAVARELRDPNALLTLADRARRADDLPPRVAPSFGAHVRDRDVPQHDLGGYDGPR